MTAFQLRTICAWATALVVCSMSLAEAQNTTSRVSVATGGAQATGGSSIASRWPERECQRPIRGVSVVCDEPRTRRHQRHRRCLFSTIARLA